MMKKILTLGLSMMCCTLTFGQAQEQKVDGYVINGVLDGKYKADKVYLLEEECINGPSRIIDSAKVTDNHYTFKGPKRDYSRMYFIKSADPACLSPLLPFFLEDGTINLWSNSEFFLNSTAKGTPNNDIFNFYNYQIKYIQDSVNRAFILDRSLYGEKDYEYENREYKRRGVHTSSRKLDIQRAFVRKYPDQIFAPFIIYWEMKADLTLDELRAERALVDPKLNEHPYTKQLDEYILLADFKVGSTIRDFVVPDQKGGKVDIRSFRGKYVLIDFWASWCGPCLREMPNVVKLYKECKGKNFEILGISLDSKKEAWLDAVKKNDMKWVQTSELKGWDSTPGKLCNVRAVPFTILLDPDGKVIALNLRGEELIAKVKEVLGKK